MKIHQIFFNNNLRNFSYLLIFEDGNIFCIDPFRSDEVLDYLKLDRLTAIINTHDHCDHYSGNAALVSRFNCSVMGHKNANIPCKTIDLIDQEMIYSSIFNEVSWTLKAIDTPGHTMSHVCILLEKNNNPFALFTGDCFFNAGVGNCHFGGNIEALFETITLYFVNLPDDLLIYPGHDYLKRNLEFTCNYEPENKSALKLLSRVNQSESNPHLIINTMKVEREINTFLRLESKNLLETLKIENSNLKKTFFTLRELRNNW